MRPILRGKSLAWLALPKRYDADQNIAVSIAASNATNTAPTKPQKRN